MTATKFDIEQAINVLSEVLGSKENVIITILEILKDDGDITEQQREEILRGILAQQNQSQKKEGRKPISCWICPVIT